MSELSDKVFAPRRSAAETKADTTTGVAREIQDLELNAREAKTERLRQARLAMEAAAPPPEEKPKRKAPVRKKA